MRADNPVESLASSLYTALADPNILPDVEYNAFPTAEQRASNKPGDLRTRRPVAGEIECYHFPQLWPSTALGFGGVGGSAMTTAYTTVLVHAGKAAVFFGGQYAYTVPATLGVLNEDIGKRNMAPVKEKGRYEQA